MTNICNELMMQDLVKTFLAHCPVSNDEKIRYMDLVTEVGEVGKELIKGSAYGQQQFQKSEHLKEEIGDCLFSLLVLCTSLNIDALHALESSLEKYKNRYEKSGQIGSEFLPEVKEK